MSPFSDLQKKPPRGRPGKAEGLAEIRKEVRAKIADEAKAVEVAEASPPGAGAASLSDPAESPAPASVEAVTLPPKKTIVSDRRPVEPRGEPGEQTDDPTVSALLAGAGQVGRLSAPGGAVSYTLDACRRSGGWFGAPGSSMRASTIVISSTPSGTWFSHCDRPGYPSLTSHFTPGLRSSLGIRDAETFVKSEVSAVRGSAATRSLALIVAFEGEPPAGLDLAALAVEHGACVVLVEDGELGFEVIG